MTYSRMDAFKGFLWCIAYLLVIFVPTVYLVALFAGLAADVVTYLVAHV